MINNLLIQFEGVGFKTYHLELKEKRIKKKIPLLLYMKIVKMIIKYL